MLSKSFSISKMLGCFPLLTTTRGFSISLWRSLVCLTEIATFLYCICTVLFGMTITSGPNNLATTVLIWAQALGISMLHCYNFVILLFSCDQMNSICNRLSGVNCFLKNIEVVIDSDFSLRFYYFVLALTLLNCVSALFLPFQLASYSLLSTMASIAAESIASDMIRPVEVRFRALNFRLKAILHGGRYLAADVEDMTDAHRELCFITKNINGFLSMHLLFLNFIAFVSIVWYSFFCSLITSDLYMTATISVWLVVNASWIVHHINLCNSTMKKAEEFNEVLYQLMMDDETYCLSNNRKLRLHITRRYEVVFSPYGFFIVDHTLILPMIAAAGTYLVILIQF